MIYTKSSNKITAMTLSNKKESKIQYVVLALIAYQPITFAINVIMNIFVSDGFVYDTLV